MSSDSIKGWEAPSSTGKHFEVLDGIRGVAILMVVVFHTFYTNPESGAVARAINDLIRTGNIGVPIFFVLSGFLIAYPFFRLRLEDRGKWYPPEYARRRLGKIAPPFYLSIVIFAFFYYLRFEDPAYFKTALGWMFGMSELFPSAPHFDVPYWSLIVEVQFYLALPVLFFFTRGLGARHTAGALFLALLAIPLLTRQQMWPENVVAEDAVEVAAAIIRFPYQLDYFAWGVLFAGVFASLADHRDQLRALSLFGYAGGVLLLVSLAFLAMWSRLFDIDRNPTRWSTEIYHLLAAVSAFLLLFFVFDPRCLGSRILGYKPLRFTGIISYEWFLFHQPVVYYFHDLFGHTGGSLAKYLGKTVLPLVITYAFSVAVYHYFSFPLMNRIRGAKLRRRNLKTAE